MVDGLPSLWDMYHETILMKKHVTVDEDDENHDGTRRSDEDRNLP